MDNGQPRKQPFCSAALPIEAPPVVDWSRDVHTHAALLHPMASTAPADTSKTAKKTSPSASDLALDSTKGGALEAITPNYHDFAKGNVAMHFWCMEEVSFF